MTSTLNVKALFWVIPAAAKVKVVDTGWHKLGDVNWDGVIDQIDLDLLTAAGNSQAGDPNWNPDCDLDGDGIVNMRDIAIAILNFGKTAPELTAPFSATVEPGQCVLIATYQNNILQQTFKVPDKTSPMVLLEFNAFKGRVLILGIGTLGAGGNFPGGLARQPTRFESRPELNVDLG